MSALLACARRGGSAASGGHSPLTMTRDEWLDQFSDELIKLRPHVSHKLARTLALHTYNQSAHPREAAREYHARQTPAPPVVAPKRAKRG